MRNKTANGWNALFLILFLIGAAPAAAQVAPIQDRYSKREAMVEMRDGVKLYVAIYSPRDRSQTYPIMMNRTPYSCQPYGEDQYRRRIGPSEFMENEGYIFVHTDVRGRWNSEGQYDNMRPHVPGKEPIDESSDTYDTISWLLDNVPNHNGKVGIWGISYPGFYSAAALPEHHPALVAASPQAPISDFFFDDFHHNGAYLQSYFLATATFGYQHNGPTTSGWYKTPSPSSNDSWTFNRNLIPLAEKAKQYWGEDNFFWQQLVEHPNYDEFWQRRSILPHLHDVKTNVMVVGGFFDAEDLYGPLHIYQELEKNNPEIHNCIVMGPWSHGDWARNSRNQVVGNVPFGQDISLAYQRDIEAPFFRHFLKGEGPEPTFEARMFDTGLRQWKNFEQWPPANADVTTLAMGGDRSLRINPSGEAEGPEFIEFVSDPENPVPYRDQQNLRIRFTPRPYMSDDQTFATQRDDVLTFQSEVLTEPVTIAGPISAELFVSTDKTAGDWIVKLIDVYPEDHPQLEGTPEGVTLAGYQQMVRGDVIRGRFRNGFEIPEPFVPGQVTQVNVPLQDVLHTFKPGHRIMVQVQSSWFPLIDVNPQTYVENIFKASAQDFVSAKHRVYFGPGQRSTLKLRIVDN